MTVRMGIHTEDVLAGNIGSPLRMKYGLVGDAVNLASRLEGLNKHYGTKIILSEKTHTEATASATSGSIPFLVTRMLDRVIVKGKSKVIGIYELVGTRSSLKPDEIKQILEYNELYIMAETIFSNYFETSSRKNSMKYDREWSHFAARRTSIKPQISQIEDNTEFNTPIITKTNASTRAEKTEMVPKTPAITRLKESVEFQMSPKHTEQSIWSMLLTDQPETKSYDLEEPNVNKMSESLHESKHMLVLISEAIQAAKIEDDQLSEPLLNSGSFMWDDSTQPRVSSVQEPNLNPLRVETLSSPSDLDSTTRTIHSSQGSIQKQDFVEDFYKVDKMRAKQEKLNVNRNSEGMMMKLIGRCEKYIESYPDDKPGQMLFGRILSRTFGQPTKMNEK
ncbi:Nitrogen permease regulator 2 [Nowakowskiella sp. JEL0078]|nr:Nitrogen permease regulator 2 [Nowakowskiella sp. JEL0078]